MTGKSNRYDVFISYRRTGGSAEARLIQAKLRQHNLRVFLDVDDLQRGHFNQALLDRIGETPNFVVILSPHSLDRSEDENDWLRREIAHALKTERNIIPILMPGFEFPKPDELPIEMRGLATHQSVSYSHEYFDGTFGKVLQYLEPTGKPTVDRPPNRRWIVAAAVALLLMAIGLAVWMNRTRGTSGDNITGVNPVQPTTTPASANSPTATPNNTGPVIATGITDYETGTEESLSLPQPYYREGRIEEWYVRSGDVLKGCESHKVAFYSYTTGGDRPGSSPDTWTDNLTKNEPLKIVSIDVEEREPFEHGKKICWAAKIRHGLVKAKVFGQDLERIRVGTSAVFQYKAGRVYKGRVESIKDGMVSIKLLDRDVFSSDSKLCLKLDHNVSGNVTFEVGTKQQ